MHSLPIETKRERKNSVIAIVHWRSLATRSSIIIETLIDFESGLRNFRGMPFLQLVTKSGRKLKLCTGGPWILEAVPKSNL
ncbi:hypothetical protein V1478_000014 [Vespula squamosa]|uniref:Uncharacterized protein n=1 Tax=Vespula squamosa TaxID=30214 RepID=A0ABD2C985_VESSQ